LQKGSQIKKNPEKLASQNYPFVVEKDEHGYYIRVPDLKGCTTWVKSLNELEDALYNAKLAWIEFALEKGWEIPKPTEEDDFSGKFLVRCPKTIHRRLVENAKREGVSLNHYVVTVLAQHSMGDRAVEVLVDKLEGNLLERSFSLGYKFGKYESVSMHTLELPRGETEQYVKEAQAA